MSTKKSHLWIPDEEVQRVDKKPTGRQEQKNISFVEHGHKLSRGLQQVHEILKSVIDDNSLTDADLLVFNVELPEGTKVQDNNKLFTSNGMQVRAVKNATSAIVTSTSSQFTTLKNRVEKYTANGSGKTYFDFIEDFKPYIGKDKNSRELNKTLNTQKLDKLDIQIMMVPNLDKSTYDSAIGKLKSKIADTNGIVQQDVYYLSDHTPVLRAIIPASALVRYENDSAVYRIEETDFFTVDASSIGSIDLSHLMLNSEIDLTTLPLVVVLDSGVTFPTGLSSLIVEKWIPDGCKGGNHNHGTKVASRVAFGYVANDIPEGNITPRARIIDCNVLDGNVPSNILISRIQEAVGNFADKAQIFNLSANATIPIEGDEMSIVGYELDMLQKQFGVQFVVSAGNHRLWEVEDGLEAILDDDDSRISPPSDSMLSIVVGAIIGADHEGSISRKNDIAPYSRRGPGFNGLLKPDISAYSGTIFYSNGIPTIPPDVFSGVLTNGGKLVSDAGTSFSAPIVSGDLAEILGIIPQRDILLAKALLYHTASPLWDTEDMDDDELAFAHAIYGRGLANVAESKHSSASKVTFLRTGTLNKTTKERVTVYMPPILAAQTGRNVARVTVTCLSLPMVNRNKGTEYLGAYVNASLKKSKRDGVTLAHVSQDYKEGRQKWSPCQQFSKLFSQFNAGDWQIWLELFSRWEDQDEEVPYALVVTIEDVSNTLDVYSEIEILNRYRPLNTLRIRLDNQQTE